MFTLLSGALNTGNIDLGTNENAEAKVNNPAQIKIVSVSLIKKDLFYKCQYQFSYSIYTMTKGEM